MKIISVLAIIYWHYTVSAQFKVVEFKDYVPAWTHLSLPANISYQTIRYFQDYDGPQELPKIHKNKMINLYNNLDYNKYYNGYYLEVVDLETGKLCWSDTYLSPFFFGRKIAMNPNITNDTLILMIIDELNTKDSSTSLWFNGIPNKIYYNFLTGNKIDSTVNNLILPDVQPIVIPNFFIPFSNNHLYNNHQYYTILTQTGALNSNNKGAILYKRVNLSPSRISQDSSNFNVDLNYYITNNQLFDINDSLIFSYASNRSEISEENSLLYFMYANSQFQTITSKEINLQINDCNSHYVIEAQKDLFVVQSSYKINDKYQYWKKYHSIYSNSGELIEKIDLSTLSIIDTDTATNTARSLTFLNSKKQLEQLICISETLNNSHKLNFYQYNSTNKLKKLRSFELVPPENALQVFFTQFFKHQDNILIQFIIKSDIPGALDPPQWSSWAMIPISDILTSDLADQKKDYKLFNSYQINDKLIINTSSEFEHPIKIILYNSSGISLWQSDNLYGSQFEIDLNSIEHCLGVYLMELISSNGDKYCEKILIAK